MTYIIDHNNFIECSKIELQIYMNRMTKYNFNKNIIFKLISKIFFFMKIFISTLLMRIKNTSQAYRT